MTVCERTACKITATRNIEWVWDDPANRCTGTEHMYLCGDHAEEITSDPDHRVTDFGKVPSASIDYCTTCGADSVDADVDGYPKGTCPQCFYPYKTPEATS